MSEFFINYGPIILLILAAPALLLGAGEILKALIEWGSKS